ncbi:PREDICTED: rho-N domain-containing protein 1, chloroplastic-like [Populus euphratica]|uniref:Rho-N domain-containing protein 1, chloroplastic-like n=1 Tax=Populus euphratica TaxID=75702 RepID=A0AAJ6T3H4_POPEU|nr:PREDICTED: rho-N domain-containing protein 1, chloroplastic-like [Populus euphratica]
MLLIGFHRNTPAFESYGSSEGRCLLCSGIYGRAVVVSPCSSHCVRYNHSQAQFGKMKCSFRASSIVCKCSGGHRRNPDLSRQNKQFSRNRNRQNEETSSFENLDESDLLTSKNGSLLSLSGTPKFQATAAPGPREEIVELFRKVHAHCVKELQPKKSKFEASQGKGRENETVDSLLKLLRKHSTEQGKKKTSTINSGNFNLDQPENGAYKKAKGTSSFNSSKEERNDALEPNTSFTRPPSKFQRKSPVPQVKFQPIYSSEDLVNSTCHLNLNGEKRNQFEILPDTTLELELDPEIEPELDSEQEPESAFPGSSLYQ